MIDLRQALAGACRRCVEGPLTLDCFSWSGVMGLLFAVPRADGALRRSPRPGWRHPIRAFTLGWAVRTVFRLIERSVACLTSAMVSNEEAVLVQRKSS